MQEITSYETERLILRPTSMEDADFVYELLNAPKWKKYIGDRNVYSIEDASQYINDKMLPQLKSHGYSNCTIIRKSDQAKIGSCGLYDRVGLDGIDLGYALLPRYEGQGYAYEAANKMVSLAFKNFNIPVLQAITSKYNLASQKLLRKLEFNFVKKVTLSNKNESLMHFCLKY